MATIKPGSATLTITSRPTVAPTTAAGGQAKFRCANTITATGSVLIEGAGSDGWKLGFMQVEWADTSWLSYRGERAADGSIFFQRSRPPARPVKACRDVFDPNFFWYLAKQGSLQTILGAPDPALLSVDHYDKPQDGCALTEVNSRTGKVNFLHEAQLEFLFCTMLVTQDPAGTYHYLKAFYWNVRWQARFRPSLYGQPAGGWTVTPVADGCGSATSGISDGEPIDPKFRGVATNPAIPGCNAIIPLYTNLPPGHPCRRETTDWNMPDVRK